MVGEAVRLLRKRYRLTRAELARLSKVSEVTIWKIEAGVTAKPSPDVLRQLAHAAVTEPITEVVNQEIAERTYAELLGAAGWLPAISNDGHDEHEDGQSRLIAKEEIGLIYQQSVQQCATVPARRVLAHA